VKSKTGDKSITIPSGLRLFSPTAPDKIIANRKDTREVTIPAKRQGQQERHILQYIVLLFLNSNIKYNG
jgi:hypothetical protein